MGINGHRTFYPPITDEIDFSTNVDYEIDELFGYDPNELTPFELQYLKEYSTRDIEESLFYEQGEPT